jgi:DNA-binding LacI/PurR family transcriptional regulator
MRDQLAVEPPDCIILAKNPRIRLVEAAAEISSQPTARRVTSYDVARAAGVSQSAVSRCFAPGTSIAPKTRDLIMKVAAELGYRPNALAQALISRRTNLVALLISSLTNLYYPEVLAELSHRLTLRNMRVLLFALDAESDVNEALEQVLRHSVDGVICAASLSEDQVQFFADRNLPLVLYNRTSQSKRAGSICCDSRAGERELVGRLLSAGHKRFGLIDGPVGSSVGEERRAAAVESLLEAGLPAPPTVRGDFSYEGGHDGLIELMRMAQSLDAVICVNDVMAIGALDACRFTLGLNVPRDISIVGFDGSGPATWESHKVTSIGQPVRRMTDAAVSMLMERIEDPAAPAERRLFLGEFLPGGSARLA